MMKLKKSSIKLKKQKKKKKKNREKLVYKTNKYTYSFENFQTISSFGKHIYDGTITLEEANDYRTDLLAKIINFREKTKPKSLEKEEEEKIVLENLYGFFEGREKVLNAFASKIFSLKCKGSGLLNTNHSKLKILHQNKCFKDCQQLLHK